MMSEKQATIIEELKTLAQNRFYVAIGISTLVLLLEFIFVPLWQFYFIPAIIGGLILGSDATRAFFAGFIGMLLAILIFMNFALINSVDAIDALIESALGLKGFGFIVQIVILLIWGFFSGLGGFIGVYLRPFLPSEVK
ncbi:MAG: hypothetical protein ACXAB2_00835 [Candidatus Hodarchaeales archaeon]|jgi:hypothetical protein